MSDPKDGGEGFSVFRDYGYRVIVHNSDKPPRPESVGIVVAQNFSLFTDPTDLVAKVLGSKINSLATAPCQPRPHS